MWKGKHTESYKSIYDVLRYPYEKHKELLLNVRANLINKGRKYWTVADINMYEAFIYTLYLTGGRISEVLSIRIRDIVLDDNREWLEFIIPTKKTRQTDEPIRSIPIYLKDPENEFALKPIIKYYDTLISIIEQDSSLDDSLKLFGFSRFVGGKVCSICGFNPHFERKIFITQKATIYNMSIPKLKKLSGHKNADNLIPYLAIGTEDIKEDLKKNIKSNVQ